MRVTLVCASRCHLTRIEACLCPAGELLPALEGAAALPVDFDQSSRSVCCYPKYVIAGGRFNWSSSSDGFRNDLLQPTTWVNIALPVTKLAKGLHGINKGSITLLVAYACSTMAGTMEPVSCLCGDRDAAFVVLSPERASKGQFECISDSIILFHTLDAWVDAVSSDVSEELSKSVRISGPITGNIFNWSS